MTLQMELSMSMKNHCKLKRSVCKYLFNYAYVPSQYHMSHHMSHITQHMSNTQHAWPHTHTFVQQAELQHSYRFYPQGYVIKMMLQLPLQVLFTKRAIRITFQPAWYPSVARCNCTLAWWLCMHLRVAFVFGRIF